IAERRVLTEPETPPQPAAVGGARAKGAPAIGDPALEDHLDPPNALEAVLQVFEQGDVVTADHDQELDIGERERRQGRQEQRGVPRAVAVSLGRIVERRLLAQVAGPALDTARCADDFHAVREPWPPGTTRNAAYNSGKIPSGRHTGTTL